MIVKLDRVNNVHLRIANNKHELAMSLWFLSELWMTLITTRGTVVTLAAAAIAINQRPLSKGVPLCTTIVVLQWVN